MVIYSKTPQSSLKGRIRPETFIKPWSESDSTYSSHANNKSLSFLANLSCPDQL